jgi:hypothetical protein
MSVGAEHRKLVAILFTDRAGERTRPACRG